MSEKVLTIAGIVASVLFGIPAWWALLIEHPDAIGPAISALRVASPIAIFLLGCFTGYHLKAWRNRADRYKALARRIPTLSVPEKAILLITFADGSVWANGRMTGPASSLYASGYLEVTHSGGLRGTCYVMPAELRDEMTKREKILDSLGEAENTARSMVSQSG